MASPSQTDIEQKLALLQTEFQRKLPNKIADIEDLWESILAGTANASALEDCHRLVHTLAGSGGTFGATTVTTASREVIHAIKSIEDKSNLSSDIKHLITALISKLKTVANNWQPSKIPYFQPLEDKHIGKRKGNLIYLVEDDELLAKELITQLEHDNFEVKHFSALNDFAKAISEKIPSAIIMDVMFKEGDIAGIESIEKFKDNYDICPPIIFISIRDDIEVRLAAAKAGAQRYFSKPLDPNKLSQTLDGLIEGKENKPFRILFVDDDVSLLKYYETVLIGAGMEVKTISNPLDTLKVLEEYKPDVIVLDVYMPECSGPEIAQVIRQDDKWSLTPVMFLSTEIDLDIQLDSMNLGGEMFMVKPIAANHLVSVLNSKAKTSRWSNRLNYDLEKNIRENEYQIVTSNLHDIVSVADASGRILEVNDKFCEISGYTRAELIGQNHRILKSNNHPNSFYEEMWETISSGKVWDGSICNFSKSGEEYWVESTIVPFLDAKGKPYKYVSARTDVTKLIEGESRLERSQKFANIGTWDWNISSGSLFWSDRIWPLFGYDKEIIDTTYDNFMAAIHPDDRERVGNAITRCVENGEDYNIEHRVIWPNGTIKWLHEHGDVIRDKHGNALHMLGVVRDITNEKEASLELQASKEKLSAYFELSPLGFALTDMQGKYISFNEAYRKICGYSVEELREIDYWTLTPKEYEEDEALQLVSLETKGRYGPYEKEYIQKDGTRIAVRLNGMVIKDENGESQIWSIIEDVDEKKKFEGELISAREEAENANRAKSQFLSSMSHELRTPMNAIMGFGQLLEMDFGNPLDDDQKENVSEILKASDHLLELINEVLDLAKIEAGRIDLSIEDVLLADVVIESLQLVLPLAEKRSISVKIFRDDNEVDISDLKKDKSIIRADYTRTKQVIINLLSNAVKYNVDNGSITIKCNVFEGSIRISVTDTGLGLSQEQQSQLFTAFNRLGAENTEIEGTGIGLVITQNIVNLMGGRIGVDSEVGKGSTFWFELPNGAATALNLFKESVDENIEIELLEPRTVLYIEDNPANLRLVTQLLSRLPNLQMWTAHEPMLGLELALSNSPDLILLDINLPGLDGFEVLKLLKEREATKNTPIIAISANAMPRDIEKGLEAGFDDYITKPININKLLRTVDERLNQPSINPP